MFVATKMIFVAAPANDTAPGSVTAVARHTWSSVAGHCDIAGCTAVLYVATRSALVNR